MDEHDVPPRLVPVVVAHRGEAAHFPENTLASLRGAVDCGVRHVEIDVQLTADRVPVLMHDESLLRTAGIDLLVTATIASELGQIPVGRSGQQQNRFTEFVPTLADALRALTSGKLTIFVELKRSSLRAFGRARVLDAVLPAVDASAHEIVIISFDRPVLELARERCSHGIGWVLGAYNLYTQKEAARLRPDYLFCNHLRLPESDLPLWSGDWRWVIYEVTDPRHARRLGERGVALVESMDACRLSRELSA